MQTQKNKEEAELENNRSVLRDKESELSSAESELRDAERKLEDAKREEQENLQTGAITGAIVLGVFTLGIGAPVGAALGAGVAAIVNAISEEVKKAKDKVEWRESDCRRARSAIQDSEQRVSSIKSQITNLEGKISELKKKRLTCHEKIDEIKAGIALLKKSIEFWELFKQASEHGTNRTSLLKKIVDKANEKGKFRALCSGGGGRTAATFLEAWESMESLAIEGATSHSLELEFKCTSCNGSYTSLPHVDGKSRFICFQCHQKHAIQNYHANFIQEPFTVNSPFNINFFVIFMVTSLSAVLLASVMFFF